MSEASKNIPFHTLSNPWEGIAPLPQRKRLPGYLIQLQMSLIDINKMEKTRLNE